MTAADTTVDIDYNRGTPSIDQPNPVTLFDNDSVTLALSGFPTSGKIKSIEFFSDANKNTSVGSWTASNTPGTISSGGKNDFECELKTQNDYTEAVIKDVEQLASNSDEECFWYSVEVTWTDANGGTHDETLDPELINKGGKGPGPG